MTVESWTREDLERLIGQEEGSSLEFKQSAALTNTDHYKKELVKDVTALANAAGGIIVYGLAEENHRASALDGGIDIAPEWIERVLDSNAEPKLQGVIVRRIEIGPQRYAFAIEVPQATAMAPHQSKQHFRYFRRHGREVLPMLDHEVRDIMRRATTPHLYLHFSLFHLRDDRFRLYVTIGNKSSAPAEYGRVSVFLAEDLSPPQAIEAFQALESRASLANGGLVLGRVYSRNFVPPNHLPIFKEQDWEWLQADVEVARNSENFAYYSLACPGFSESRSVIIRRGNDLVASAEIGPVDAPRERRAP